MPPISYVGTVYSWLNIIYFILLSSAMAVYGHPPNEKSSGLFELKHICGILIPTCMICVCFRI